MKFNKIHFFILILVIILNSFSTYAQDVTNDTVVKKLTKTSSKRQKIDGIIATVGDYIILDSDIDKSFLELTSQKIATNDISRCQMLGKLLEDRLYAHQALQDSVVVTDADIKTQMEQQISYMQENLGTMENVLKYFKKNNEDDFRSDMAETIKMNKFTSEMQRKIVDGVVITPEEVRSFFNKIPQADLPIFGAEVEVAQIIIQPKISELEKQKTIDKLKEFKKEIQDGGSSFATKAVLYSQDPSSSPNGGFYKMNRKTPFVKEFKDVAFSLGEGEISEPFETVYGYHIIMIDKIKGQEVELRHILLAPIVSEQDLKDAKEKILLIRSKIESKAISFAEAARAESDEKETRTNGGVLINPKTQDTKFELTKMDPSLYSEISNLKTAELTQPIFELDQSKKKSYKLICVTNKIEEHTANYSIDYLKIRELALKEKQIEAIAKWFDEKIKANYIKINLGEYRECVFTNNWLKK